MKLTFLGATHEVTGSCNMITVGGHHILVDCGMEQGANIFENQEIPVNPAEIDCVLLTHAHIDHSGKLPLLYKNGFRGKIYATDATCNLCDIMLRDSAHIQMFEAEWKNRKAKRAGREEVLPIYDINDAENAIKKLYHCKYNEKIQILENVVIRFTDIGHLLGSAAIEIWLTEGDVTKKIVFSGDVGNTHQPIIRDPEAIEETDYLVLESTYGNRLHPERPDYIGELTKFIQRTLDRGGNVVIPSFAVGRTQEMLYFIRQIKEQGLIKGHDNFPVYVDSPLANEATAIFMQCNTEYFDDETRALIDKGINPIFFPNLITSVTSDDSKMINSDPRPKVIISASGMCEAGRIRHHLKHNLWRQECLVLFVGYQANGTLGRAIYEGATEVKLFGETINVNAEIQFLDGVSGHADKNGLINWLGEFKTKPQTVFINHGDDDACTEFTECLKNEYGYNAVAPYSGTEFDLASGVIEYAAPPRIAVHSSAPQPMSKSARVFERLMNAAKRLVSVAKRCEGMANKDLARFADQIDALCDKWSR